MTVFTPKFGMGASVTRLEDRNFITGTGRYTDDIGKPGMLYAYVLRSPVAKGRFAIVSVEAAKAAPGVHLVLTGDDIANLAAASCCVSRTAPRRRRAIFRFFAGTA
jgi:carbon-monoxide dehydrogenase large subunit